jgi:hypothetical protein
LGAAAGTTGPIGRAGAGSLRVVAPSSNNRQADLGDEDPDDGYDVDDDADEAEVKPSLATRFLKSLEGPAVKGNTKRAVEQLDDRERLYSFVAAGLAVVLGLLIYFIENDNKHFRLAKGQLTPQTTLAVGLISGALLFGATWLGRRAPVGFISLFAFLFFGTRYFVGVPFLLLGVWLLYHSYKVQKEANALRKANRATGTAAPERSSGAKAPPTKADRTSRPSKGPARPEANKRYTPKRPPPPAPKPSRRERKATKASD